MLASGTTISVSQHIITGNGSMIPAGTRAVVLGVASSGDPQIYLCETHPDDVYEVEEFFCFSDQIFLGDEVD